MSTCCLPWEGQREGAFSPAAEGLLSPSPPPRSEALQSQFAPVLVSVPPQDRGGQGSARPGGAVGRGEACPTHTGWPPPCCQAVQGSGASVAVSW